MIGCHFLKTSPSLLGAAPCAQTRFFALYHAIQLQHYQLGWHGIL